MQVGQKTLLDHTATLSSRSSSCFKKWACVSLGSRLYIIDLNIYIFLLFHLFQCVFSDCNVDVWLTVSYLSVTHLLFHFLKVYSKKMKNWKKCINCYNLFTISLKTWHFMTLFAFYGSPVTDRTIVLEELENKDLNNDLTAFFCNLSSMSVSITNWKRHIPWYHKKINRFKWNILKLNITHCKVVKVVWPIA